MPDRARLLAGTAKLDEGTRRLEESQRIAMETEQTGADILLNLRGQREQIEHARDTVSAGGILVGIFAKRADNLYSWALRSGTSTVRLGR